MKVTLLKPLCGPKHNHPAGATVDLPKELAQALIDARDAKKHEDPKAASEKQAKARASAIEAIDKALAKDVEDVQAQLRKDCAKPGAVKADLEAAANVVIEELKAKAEEAKAGL